jgi:hypothetical protein
MAHDLALGMSAAGWTVVSGLARGVDAAAHRGALAERGRTIGVLGCGIDRVYPAGHRDLYASVGRSGLLLSEFEPNTPPLRYNFPRRNRIIAALADAVVVVQAPERSGALITADMALDMGREVFAVPGPADQAVSAGWRRRPTRCWRSSETPSRDRAKGPPCRCPIRDPPPRSVSGPLCATGPPSWMTLPEEPECRYRRSSPC